MLTVLLKFCTEYSGEMGCVGVLNQCASTIANRVGIESRFCTRENRVYFSRERRPMLSHCDCRCRCQQLHTMATIYNDDNLSFSITTQPVNLDARNLVFHLAVLLQVIIF